MSFFDQEQNQKRYPALYQRYLKLNPYQYPRETIYKPRPSGLNKSDERFVARRLKISIEEVRELNLKPVK